MSAVEVRTVGIIVDRIRIDSPWADHRWLPVQALPGPLDGVEPWTVIADEPGRLTRYFAGAATVELYPRETDTLRYNLADPNPRLYVFLRHVDAAPGIALIGVTACPGEAHAHADTGSDLVEPVPMPASVRGWVEDFVARHHVERPVYKRARDRADPEALGVRRRISSDAGRDDG